jgi:hypothetical protein
VWLIFYSFRIMVGIGFFFAGLMAVPDFEGQLPVEVEPAEHIPDSRPAEAQQEAQ